MQAIQTNHLTKHYQRGKIKALTDCSISVEEGMIFSLLGPNGAGKTTLIKALLGIVFPTSGSATIFGEPISNYKIHEEIGYLAESHRFPDFLTANQVLYYYGKMSGVSSPILKEKIPQLLKIVKLEEWGDVRIRKFSKGMLQRMGIAQALINDPKMVFLDEPTDGIDPVGRREIRDLLARLREEGKTIFLNSHLLSEVERVSDEIAILKNGKLIRQGRVEDFISIEDQYQLKLSDQYDITERICNELEMQMERHADHYVVSVRDEAHLNHLIDRLREEHVIITGIIPRKISLEDYFIDVIEEKREVEQ